MNVAFQSRLQWAFGTDKNSPKQPLTTLQHVHFKFHFQVLYQVVTSPSETLKILLDLYLVGEH